MYTFYNGFYIYIIFYVVYNNVTNSHFKFVFMYTLVYMCVCYLFCHIIHQVFILLQVYKLLICKCACIHSFSNVLIAATMCIVFSFITFLGFLYTVIIAYKKRGQSCSHFILYILVITNSISICYIWVVAGHILCPSTKPPYIVQFMFIKVTK